MSSGTSYGGGGLGDLLNDFSGIENHANNHAGDSGDRSLFSSALSMIKQNAGELQNESVDEEHAVKAHKKYYGGKHGGGGDRGEATSSGMGAAAAMQALKMFNSGGSIGGSGGQGSQEFMGMAMGQAAKLFGELSRPLLVVTFTVA